MIKFVKYIFSLINSKLISPFKIALYISLIFSAIFLWYSMFNNAQNQGFITSIDRKIVDSILRYRTTQATSQKVGLITVDAKSIKQLGRWPWSRKLIADAIHTLNDYYKVSVIGFDIVFSESDQTFAKLKSTITELSAEQIDPQLVSSILEENDSDRELANEINNWDNIVTGYFFRNEIKASGLDRQYLDTAMSHIQHMKIPIIITKVGNTPNTNYIHTAEFPEINIFSDMIKSKSGFFSITPDPDDGIVRRVESVFKMGKDFYPSLPVVMHQTYLDQQTGEGHNSLSISLDDSGMTALHIGDNTYSTDSDGTLFINFRGKEGTIKHFSFVDVLNKVYPKEQLMGKLVFIGVTELGIFDIRSTPIASTYPGLEVQGTILDNLLQKNFLEQNNITRLISLFYILLIGILIGLIKKWRDDFTSDLLVFMLMLLVLISNYLFLSYNQMIVSSAYPILTAVVSWFLILIYTTFTIGKDKKFIKSAFSQYLAPKVIDQLLDDPDQLKLGGRRKNLSIMFTDIAGFSSISENFDVYTLTNTLNAYLTSMVNVIMKYEGTVDKFEGDAIIAFWGAPLDIENHARQACLACIEMQEILVDFRDKLEKSNLPSFKMRVGINTGDVMVGNFGSAQRMDYTVIGDSANLAARLEGVNKIYGTQNIISHDTKSQISDECSTRLLDEVQVVGKDKPIRIYELQTLKSKLSPNLLEANQIYEASYILYRQKKWENALTGFKHALRLKPDDMPTKIFISRIEHLLTKKGDEIKDWTGIYRLTNK